MRSQRRQRGVEVAKVGRAQHDFGQQFGQATRFTVVNPAQRADAGPSHPATATVEVYDDVAGRRPRVELDGDHVLRRRRGEPLEDRQGRGWCWPED
jgi:hypothetical protein